MYFTFQEWLKNELDVCVVYELATGICFPRRGKTWAGLHTELVKIRDLIKANPGRKYGHYAAVWLKSRMNYFDEPIQAEVIYRMVCSNKVTQP